MIPGPVKNPGRMTRRPGFSFLDDTGRMRDCTMTNTLVEWFRGKNAEDGLSYDFAESHPVWKMWWFWGGIAVACVVIIWIF